MNYQGALTLAPEEQQFYAQAFQAAGPGPDGFLPGPKAAQLLQRTGLQREMLHQIWELSDVGRAGRLSQDRFFVALRLIAHMQCGRGPPSAELALIQPGALPRLEGMEGSQFPTQQSMTPLNTAESLQSRSRGRDRTPSPARSPHSPTVRERRKYASLFLKKDGGTSFVDGAAARELMQRSGLDTSLLANVWDLADADRDGRLTFPEFVVMMHLTSRLKYGQPLPGPEGLPPELKAVCTGLAPPEELAAQRSRSPSPMSGTETGRSSPRGSQQSPVQQPPMPMPLPMPSTSPAFSPLQDPAPPLQQGTSPDFSLAGTTSQMTPSPDFSPAGAASQVMPISSQFESAFGQERMPSKEIEPRKDSIERPPSAFKDLASRLDSEQRQRHRPHEFPREEDRVVQASRHAYETGRKPIDSEDTVEHLEALIFADQRIVKRLRRDVDAISDEIARLDDLCEREDREARREKVDGQKLDVQRQQLEQQLLAMKQQLLSMKEEHHQAHLEHIGLRRDRDHYRQEAQFLEKALEEDQQNINAVRQANEYLEKSLESINKHCAELEQVRKEALEQVNVEKEQMRREERDIAELKRELEGLRNEHTSFSGRSPASPTRSQTIPGSNPIRQEEMQFGSNRSQPEERHSGGIGASIGGSSKVRPKAPEPDERSPVPQPHSWALSLGQPAQESLNSGRFDQPGPGAAGPPGYRPPGRMFTNLSDREGV